MSNERLQHIKAYFANKEKVKVEIPAVITKNAHTKQTIISRFNGIRCGYQFVNGIAEVEQKDLSTLCQIYPNLIIHNEEGVQ